jgi:cell division protein FtsB
MKKTIEVFGCFLTGFNYQLLNSCSEVARKMLKRYTGLLMLISIVWAVIGFCFATRYLKLGVIGGIVLAIVCVIAIVMIERNIILSNKGNRGMMVFRFVLAFVMAIIGSLIIDQVMFSEDIEEQRIVVVQRKVNENFPIKSKELKDQIQNLNEQILNLETRQRSLSDEVGLNPTIKSYTRTTTTSIAKGDSVPTSNMTSVVNDVANPKINELNDVQQLLKNSYTIRQEKDSLLLALRADLQAQYENRKGFLDELIIMVDVVGKSWVSMVVYGMWFLFFLAIELFIVFSKLGETENDYHKLIQQQMELHNRRLDLLQRH